MVLDLLFFILGLGILIKAADFLVEGASAAALRFRLNPMVIGLTVVAFGTSAPELVVSISSALTGNTAIAFGNVVGSNIANILLILGISAIIAPLSVNKNTVWKEVPMSFLGALVLLILGFQNILDTHSFKGLFGSSDLITGSLTFSNGLILLGFFIIFIYYTFGISKVTGDESPSITSHSLFKSILFITGGLIGLIGGSKLLVDNAVLIARTLSISDQLIGLTLVAVGTSIPELITSIVAAMKGKVELAIGNVVGSNIFNIFLILGITSMIREIPVNGDSLIDIFVLFAATLILFISFFVIKKGIIGRFEGVSMIGVYCFYLYYLISR